LNLNGYTSDAAMLLSRLGYSHNAEGMLLIQPIIMEMTKVYERDSENGKSKTDAIEKVLKKYTEEHNVT